VPRVILSYPTLTVQHGDESRVYNAVSKSRKYYQAGFVWSLLAAPAMDSFPGLDTPGFLPEWILRDGHANVLSQLLVRLNGSSLQKGHECTDKNALFESLFAQKGYTVHRYNQDDKTMCLISKVESPVRFFWHSCIWAESADKKTNFDKVTGQLFLEQLMPNGKLIDWAKQATKSGRKP